MLGFAPLGGAPLGAQSPDPTATPPADGVAAVDAVTLGDTVSATSPVSNILMVEGITATDPLAIRWTANGVIADLAYWSDTAYQGAQQYNEVLVSASDSAKLTDLPDAHRGAIAAIADTLLVADVLAALYGAVVTETLKLSAPLSGQAIYNLFGTELIRIADRMKNSLPVTVQDMVWLASTMSAQTASILVEAMRIGGQLQGSAQYNVSLVQSVRLADSLARFLGADIADAVAVADLLVGLRLVTGIASDTAKIEDSFGGQLLLSVTLDDGIELSPDQALQMLYNPTLADGVDIQAGWLEPNGSFTAWAMNTRSGAVTEYADYAFNSFAQVGNAYIGASADGLYELLGDTDDGDNIIATIKGGYLQFGGTHLSRLKEAYIAARSDGVWMLNIVSGDGDTYSYQVANRSMRSTKFHMGKGQRARYFSYELVSSGQDFDLDTLEFVPIVVQRRV